MKYLLIFTFIINLVLLLNNITSIILSGISLKQSSNNDMNYIYNNITNNITITNDEINYNFLEYNLTINVGYLSARNITIEIKFITDNTTFVVFTLNSKTFPCAEDIIVPLVSNVGEIPSNLIPRQNLVQTLFIYFPIITHIGNDTLIGYILFSGNGVINIGGSFSGTETQGWNGTGMNCSFETTNLNYLLRGLPVT